MNLVSRIYLSWRSAPGKKVLRELAAGELVIKELRIEKPAAELAHNRIRFFRNIDEFRLLQRARRLKHGAISKIIGLLIVSGIHLDLSLENHPFSGGEIELGHGHHFPGTLTHPHVAHCEYARVSPIRIKRRIGLVRRHNR